MKLIVRAMTWIILAANVSLTQAIASGAATVEPTATPIVIEIGQSYRLQSEILEEERTVMVRVPEGYDDPTNVDMRYPVIYLLDGDRHFAHGSIGAEVLEQRDRMPRAIIVALPNNHGTRERDLARESDNFLRFMNEELFTFIAAKYRTSGHKTLFGHSLAGYFTLSVLVDHNEMFNNYIAASAAVHARDGELVGKFERFFTSNPTASNALFLTMTEMADEGREVTEVLERMIRLFEQSAPKSFKWRYEFIAAQVHLTTPYLTIYPGLSHVFSDFQAPNFIDTKAFEDNGGMAALDAFFARRTSKYGAEEGIPQATLRQIAYLHSQEGKHQQALAFFNKNAQAYPARPRVYNSLGDGYAAAGQLAEAQKAYQHAVRLAAEQGDEDVDWFSRNLRRNDERMAHE